MIPRWDYFFDEGLTPDPTGQFVKYEDHAKAMKRPWSIIVVMGSLLFGAVIYIFGAFYTH